MADAKQAETAPCPWCGAQTSISATSCLECGQPTSSLSRGTLLSHRYEVLEPLGKGGMGVVYKALDRELDEIVAVKCLRPDDVSPTDEQRFRSELKLARRISHPNVCRVHDFGRDGSLLYIVMELVRGQSLRERLRRGGRLAPSEAGPIVEQIAAGLDAIHSAGIVHRDLKPANVVLDTVGILKLMDFGIAKDTRVEADRLTVTGRLVGTPAYMSPEQVQDDMVDLRADVYSLAVMAFELLTGRLPLQGETPIGTMLKHVHETPELERFGLDPMVVAVLRRALEKRPEARFATASRFADALSHALDDSPAGLITQTDTDALEPPPGVSNTARPGVPTLSPTDPRAGRPPRPWRTPMAVLAVAGLAMAGITLYRRIGEKDGPAKPAVAPLAGFALIDARPWGRVIEIRNERGERLPLPTEAFTPLRFSLPPGSYEAVLVGPDSVDQQTAVVTVRSGVTTAAEVPFRRISALEYAQGVKW